MSMKRWLFQFQAYLAILVLLFRSQEERLSWAPIATCLYGKSFFNTSGKFLQRQDLTYMEDNWSSPPIHAPRCPSEVLDAADSQRSDDLGHFRIRAPTISPGCSSPPPGVHHDVDHGQSGSESTSTSASSILSGELKPLALERPAAWFQLKDLRLLQSINAHMSGIIKERQPIATESRTIQPNANWCMSFVNLRKWHMSDGQLDSEVNRIQGSLKPLKRKFTEVDDTESSDSQRDTKRDSESVRWPARWETLFPKSEDFLLADQCSLPRLASRRARSDHDMQEDEDKGLVVRSHPKRSFFHLACPFYITSPDKYRQCLVDHDSRSIEDLIRHVRHAHQRPYEIPRSTLPRRAYCYLDKFLPSPFFEYMNMDMSSFIAWEKLIAKRRKKHLSLMELTSPEKDQLPRPSPEDFAMRGRLYSDDYFPNNWFRNDKIDEDEKYLEMHSISEESNEMDSARSFYFLPPKLEISKTHTLALSTTSLLHHDYFHQYLLAQEPFGSHDSYQKPLTIRVLHFITNCLSRVAIIRSQVAYRLFSGVAQDRTLHFRKMGILVVSL
ncbi:Telomerase-binding protein EST1A [Fusarium austroafricanum]|uniref:Telomerase-binding protein EST1A n=1 Tax=Fusarium austroafricanum TaxID=2364996 RepID=A0A8H4NC77_9HYPO|nr:Telomerase-binding protein EST1A [Fusarium austroafricanum]